MVSVFRILGPLEVELDERLVSLGGRRERAVLAILLLNLGEVVSVERLIDGLWGDARPSSAKHMVHEYVSRLRTALVEVAPIETRPPGYMLESAGELLDARQFARLVGAARAAAGAQRHAEALGSYNQALALWRGDALADIALEGHAQIAAARLDQERRLVGEERIDAALALGQHLQLIPELEHRVDEAPLRERSRAQLMLALYRSGRQTDALERYREGRALLVEQTGIEPGRDLRQLERAILTQDPALELATPMPAGDVATSPRERATSAPSRFGRWATIALGGAATAALIAAIAWFATSRGGAPPVALVQGNAVAVLDAQSGRLTGSIPVVGRPGPVVAGAGFLWVSNLDEDSISKIALASEEVVGSIPLGMQPSGLAPSGRSIFAVGTRPTDAYVTVKRIDPTFDTTTRLAHVATVIAGDAGALAATRAGGLLVAPASGLLTRIDPRTGRATIVTDPSTITAAAAHGFGSSWLVEPDANSVVRVGPSGTRVPITVGQGPSAIAIGDGAVWVANRLDDTVMSINPATNTINKDIFTVGGAPSGIALSGHTVWVADSGTGSVTRIDLRARRSTSVPVGGSPQSLIVADGKVWVTVQRQALSQAAAPGGTVIVNRPVPSAPLSLDPALEVLPDGALILYSTCLELLNYPDMAGADGSRLVPDAATALPSLSRDRRTLTFVIRPGLRFSPPSNQVVTAATFRSSIERSLSPRLAPTGEEPLGLGSLSDVVGARAFSAGTATHISGVAARGNTLTIQLLQPDPALPARLATSVFCALPTDTPRAPMTGAIPSAGPYYIASRSGQDFVLARNPNYHGTRPHALGRIIIRYGMSIDQNVSQIKAGRADYGHRGVPTADAAQLQKRYGAASPQAAAGHQRYFLDPDLGINYIALNTRRSLFSHAGMRQAANYAIDRAALARAGGDPHNRGPLIETDSYLPPGMPGYSDLPNFSPKPDLAHARSLIGTVHRRAILYACNLPPCQQDAHIIKHDLARIGIDVEPHYLELHVMLTKISQPGGPYDMALVGDVAESDDPGDFLQSQLGQDIAGGANYDHYHSSALSRSFAAADRLSTTRRLLAYAKLDTTLIRDAAPWIVFGSPVTRAFFSARIGCITHQPVYGIDLGALCIRTRP